MRKIFDPLLKAKAQAILAYIGSERVLDNRFYAKVRADYGANKSDVDSIIVHLQETGLIEIHTGIVVTLTRVAE